MKNRRCQPELEIYLSLKSWDRRVAMNDSFHVVLSLLCFSYRFNLNT